MLVRTLSHGCINSILWRKLSCRILWKGNYELETTDRRKFTIILPFEDYYIALSHPADVLKIGRLKSNGKTNIFDIWAGDKMDRLTMCISRYPRKTFQ